MADKKSRDIMSDDCTCIGENDSVLDAAKRLAELGVGDGKTVTIGADDPIDEALRTMTEHKVRRLPVIDDHKLVGVISQADIATNIDEEKVGDLVEAISAAPWAQHGGAPRRRPAQRRVRAPACLPPRRAACRRGPAGRCRAC